jgi:hypothetical protein
MNKNRIKNRASNFPFWNKNSLLFETRYKNPSRSFFKTGDKIPIVLAAFFSLAGAGIQRMACFSNWVAQVHSCCGDQKVRNLERGRAAEAGVKNKEVGWR